MKLVIAEKPSVARELAKVLGATTKRDGYIEGREYSFTWAFGHLIQLAQPEAYGYSEWSAANLPMLPEKFQLLPNQKYNATKKQYESDAGVLKQLAVIQKLFNDGEEIIVATDAGREGELIFRYIYYYLQCKKPFKRLWISSQTDKAIIEGFKNVEEGKKYDRLYDAAKGRSEADWLVGMNATRALTIASGIKGVFSIGRVQTPTLAIICERYNAHQNFIPAIYFKVLLSFNKDNIPFTAISEKSYTTKEEALQAQTAATTKEHGNITSIDIEDKKESPPLLYDLTALQREANKKYGLTANKTLEIAQDLYERKLITYPRTGSRYIGEDVFEKISALIAQFETHALFGVAASYLKGKKLHTKSVNDGKVTDHHALLPTENIVSELVGDALSIYNLIVYRLLEAFHEDCLKKAIHITIDAGANYVVNGTTIMHLGWRMVKNQQEEEEEKTEENSNAKLPTLAKEEQLSIVQSAVEQKQTKPKPIHNEASLLAAMETCGREIEDEELKEAIKETGLGTPATRASIIETLCARV
ncbi:MAG TPA: DNA topoisomerase, partial [Chitinophagaceae bacterium]|nr:DNA topoisomerase [Chitinophagaceae bacterium]